MVKIIEITELEKEIEELEKAYRELRNMLSHEENMSGICYDGLVDYFYEKYYIPIKAQKDALKDNFRLNIILPSVHEIDELKKKIQNELIENAKKHGCYF